jgi:hypothetical protein
MSIWTNHLEGTEYKQLTFVINYKSNNLHIKSHLILDGTRKAEVITQIQISPGLIYLQYLRELAGTQIDHCNVHNSCIQLSTMALQAL